MRILVTGGAGFLGRHFVRALLEGQAGAEVVNLDALTYAGSRAALRELDSDFGDRHRFVHGDIRDAETVARTLDGCGWVVHLAAETHVDRSIRTPEIFVETNVVGTQVLLHAAVQAGVERFVHVSTDEVYGHLPLEKGDGRDGAPFTEADPLAPRSPYAASKAASDLLAGAAFATHGLPVVITRGCNGYGEGQYPEKLIPLAIRRILEGRPVPIYGAGDQVREWVHATDQAQGILAALIGGRAGEVYNLGDGESRSNLALIRELLRVMGRPEDAVEHVADRPGHDLRYALDGSKARVELDWRPSRTLAGSLPDIVEWYLRAGGEWWS